MKFFGLQEAGCLISQLKLDNEKIKIYDKLNKGNQQTAHSGKFCRLLNTTNLNSGRAIEKEDIFMAIEGGKKYTVSDIAALLEGERAELIGGEMFMMAAPTLVHQDLLMWLSYTIKRYITEHKGKCRVLPAPFAVYIKSDQYNYVEPDISVICDRDKLDNKGCYGAPD